MEYVLITPARNEAAYIEETIRSVIRQSVLPKRWVIVSDGSTDRTDEIVMEYLKENAWINLVRMPDHRDRTFAAKVQCLRAGYETVKGFGYDLIGSLDADISFDEKYFEFLIQKFREDPRLGVAGTPFVEVSGQTYDYSFTSIEHVSGACQIFRRRCFEEIGGYVPVKGGGIDWIAVTTARMRGWKTRTFPEKTCLHHRPMGTGNTGSLGTWFRNGRKDYYLGGHPLWELFRACYQMGSKPYVLGGGLLFFGYTWGMVTKTDRPVSEELMTFHRKEQMKRLRSFLSRRLSGK